MRRALLLLLAGLMFTVMACKQDKYAPAQYLSDEAQKRLIRESVYYSTKLPPNGSEETKFSGEFDWYYDAAAHETELLKYYKTADGTDYFLVGREARSINPMREGIGGKVKYDASGKMIEYEEIFRTWKMVDDTLQNVVLSCSTGWYKARILQCIIPNSRPTVLLNFRMAVITSTRYHAIGGTVNWILCVFTSSRSLKNNSGYSLLLFINDNNTYMSGILITGGSGMIGSKLTEMLVAKGHVVTHLERSKKPSVVKTFMWDVAAGVIDKSALKGVDAIVHLAGAGVADKRWTHDRKKEILESRTQSTSLLFETLKAGGHQVKTFVCASAIGYYGFTCDNTPVTESQPPGTDFLAHVTQRWEHESERINTLGVRVVNIRTGIVLSKSGGALPKIAKPIRLYVGAPLGDGKQIMSWIHIDDQCGIIIKAIEDQKLSGAYNSVAPNPVSNEVLTRAIAKVLNKPILIPGVPAFALRIILGQMASTVTTGCNISSAKIEAAGYVFRYKNIDDAVKDALKK